MYSILCIKVKTHCMQVDIYLKLLLIKSNPVVFLVALKD